MTLVECNEERKTGPLSKVRVVEIAGLGPSPFCAMLLADLGADVIRIDRSDRVGGEGQPVDAALFRGRPSVAMDLKHPEAADVVLRLVERADAFVEGFRPGVAERLGIGPEPCLLRNPQLVYGRMTGWGQTGPLADRPGHDINYIALTGALAAIGTAETPLPPLNLVGDFGGGGLLLAFGIVSALLESRVSGKGQVVDAAMTDGSALLMTMIYGMYGEGSWTNDRGANLLDGAAPFYGVYATADKRHVAVGCLEAKFYLEMLALLRLDDPALVNHLDRSAWPAIRAALTDAFRKLTTRECEVLFDGSEVCIAPVLDLDEAPKHAHNVQRQTFYQDRGTTLPAPAPRFSRTPTSIPHPSVRAGENTSQALQKWGFTRSEFEELQRTGVILQS
jgi:alpha-methylacyl-CoA racemase